jgi:hypothetical protein
VEGNNLRVSLEKYQHQLKTFALVSILSRITYTAGLSIFFVSTIDTRLWALFFLLALLGVQVAILIRMWRNRLRAINTTVGSLKMGE